MVRRANGEGSIYQRGEKWIAAVTFPDGKRRTRTRGTPAEAKRALRELQEEYRQGLSPQAGRLTFAEYADQWLESRSGTVRNTTLEYYEDRLDHVKFYLGAKKLSTIRPLDVSRMYAQLRTERGLGGRSLNSIHGTLKQALAAAVTSRLLAWNPMEAVTAPTYEQKEITTLSAEDVTTLLTTARERNLTDFTIVYVLVNLGLRVSESVALRWSDIDWQRQELRVRLQDIREEGGIKYYGPVKSKAGRRTIELSARMVAVLREHQAREAERRVTLPPLTLEAAGLLFLTDKGTPYNRGTVDRHLKKLCRAAGVPLISPHVLRHTCATLLLAEGTTPRVVTERLGHSRVSMTLERYGHVMPGQQKQASDLLDDLLGV